MAKQKFTISQFYCKECGNKIPLPRKTGKQREKDHTKHIYCIKCKIKTPHNEVREFDFAM